VKRVLHRTNCRYGDNIKMDPIKIELTICTVFISLRKGPMVVSCEYSNEHLGSIQEQKFLDYMTA
jgi:hypothetical protein